MTADPCIPGLVSLCHALAYLEGYLGNRGIIAPPHPLFSLKAHQALLPKLLAELLRHPGLRGAGPPKGILGVLERVVGFFRAQQRKGLLRSDEPPEEMALAFVGPLMARFLLGEALGVRLPLDKAAYLRGYLEGRYGAGRGGQSELR